MPAGHVESSRPTRALKWVPVAIAAVALATLVAATPRGFDLSDEGSYWWVSAHPDRLVNSVTYYHRFTGWIYGALGWNIAAVRVARLVAIVACTWFVGRGLMRWLDSAGIRYGSSARPAVVAMALIAPLGGAVWLPQSLAYNDLVLLELLVITGCMLRSVLADDVRVAALWAMGSGLAIWGVAMTKFSAALAVAVVGIGLVAIDRTRPRQTGASGALLAAQGVGAGVGALWWHLAVMSLGDTWSGMKIGFDDASTSHGSESLWVTYRPDLRTLLALAVFGLAAVVSRRWVRPGVAFAAWIVGAGAVLLIGPASAASGGLDRLTIAGQIGPLLACGAVVWAGTRRVIMPGRFGPLGWSRAALALILASVPLLAAVGTNNSLLTGAIAFAPFWMLAGFVALAGRRLPESRPLVGFAGLVVVLYSALGVDGTWRHPYRQVPLTEATSSVAGVGPFDGIRVDPQLAESVADIDGAVRVYTGTGHRWMLPFWRLPGLAYATGSDTPEFVWAPDAVERNLRAIETACTSDDPIIVVTTDTLEAVYVDALTETCGAEFPSQWDEIGDADLGGDPVRLVGLRGR